MAVTITIISWLLIVALVLIVGWAIFVVLSFWLLKRESEYIRDVDRYKEITRYDDPGDRK